MRRVSLFLLLGALFGFLGQQAAYAGGPAFAPMMEASHTMPSGIGCPEAQEMPKASHEAPCKGLTLACIAQMGCVIPMTLQDRLPLVTPPATVPLALHAAAVTFLTGRDVPPEPEPPPV